MIEIISVGTELLLGDIVNTNAVYLSKRLAAIGQFCVKQTTVGDNPERLARAIKDAFSYCETVLITGGLGPTDDDVTREVAAGVWGLPMEFHEEVWQGIQSYLFKRNQKTKKISINNQKQAFVPQGASILANKNGTAPGLVMEKNHQRMILLPGPPSEMQPMFEESVIPLLLKGQAQYLVSKYLRLFGMGESDLEMTIKDLLDAQTNPTLALYAKAFEVVIRVTATDSSQEVANQMVNQMIEKLIERVGQYIYMIGDDQIAEIESALPDYIANLLLQTQTTISIAESITGGFITSSLIDQAGISSVLKEGLVTYANESKKDLLGVHQETLEKFGAVSLETAREMVEGVAKRHNTQAAIATTGIAGPASDHTHKPVGLVYIATKLGDQVVVTENQWAGDRQSLRKRASYTALHQLGQMIEKR